MSYAPDLQHCGEEIADIEHSLRDGHLELEGLCLALADWNPELRILRGLKENRRQDSLNPAAACERESKMCYLASR